ncbi:MAG: hypothetical protein COB35_01765 [Gammaproteobacteria bacterium]|nr:MAG: hypothetical protein COB35_01765 [Gammaproteobacteria bacterium]
MFKIILVVCLIFAVMGCANKPFKNGQAQWDFDHHVQFKQTKITAHKYRLEVVANGKADFSVLATFLIRRSLDLCKSYGFKMEVLAGIESFNHQLESPNMLMPSLAANIECPAN